MARIRKNEAAQVTEGPMTWRIAVYIRLSKEDGGDESESVINQKKILTEYLESFFDDPHVVVDFYIDDGLTGTDDTRADFMRMIADIEQGRVNCVLCKTLARAFRNYSDQGYYLEYYFPQKNVRFISTGDPKIDTYTNPEAITGLEVPITGLMNDRFAGRTSNDVRRTFNTKRRKGEFIGAFPPYGYLKDPKDKNHLVLDEDIVPIKRDMLRWIVQDGMSLGGVARKLNELGIPNPTAYKHSKGWNYTNPHAKDNDGLWTGSTVKRMLLDKVNLGHMVQGQQRVVSYKVHDKVAVPEKEWFVVENTHEPTFSPEEYAVLETTLMRDTRTPNGKPTVHLFSGFLRCFDCKKAMHRHPCKGIVYYVCRTYGEKSKDRCSRHSIREDQIEEAVLEAIRKQMLLVAQLSEMVKRIHETPVVQTKSKRVDALLTSRMQELARLQSAADSLYLDWKNGDISRNDHSRMKAKFDGQLKQLAQIIATLEKEKQQASDDVSKDNPLFVHFLKYRDIQNLDRGVLIALLDTVFIHEGKKITIRFKYADQFERIVEFIEENAGQATASM